MYWIQHYVIKFVSDLRQVGGFLQALLFPPQYNWNIVKSGVKHHKPNPRIYDLLISDFYSTEWMGSVEVEVNQIVNENCYIYHCCHISIINRRPNIFQGFLFMISQLCILTLLANGSSQYLVIFCCCFMAILKIDWLVFNQCQVCSVQVNTWWELTVNIPPISTRNNHISPQITDRKKDLRHMTLKIQVSGW